MAIAANSSEASVLIFIDQFEELLGVNNNSSNNDESFLEWLGDAINQAEQLSSCPLIVVVTSRSDFFANLQQAPALKKVKYVQFSVRPIPKEELGIVIEGPAKIAKLELGVGLVSKIIVDIETQNALPLLAFTLSNLWEKYRKNNGGGLNL